MAGKLLEYKMNLPFPAYLITSMAFQQKLRREGKEEKSPTLAHIESEVTKFWEVRIRMHTELCCAPFLHFRRALKRDITAHRLHFFRFFKPH